ncbi:hypothetical protein Tco_1510273 [Tanacetum coccineum]
MKNLDILGPEGYGPTMLLLRYSDYTLIFDLTGDEDLIDEDGDTGMGDSIGVSVSLGGEISSGGKKSRESNISGGKIAGKEIITWGDGMESYACMTFIYGSS